MPTQAVLPLKLEVADEAITPHAGLAILASLCTRSVCPEHSTVCCQARGVRRGIARASSLRQKGTCSNRRGRSVECVPRRLIQTRHTGGLFLRGRTSMITASFPSTSSQIHLLVNERFEFLDPIQ